MRGRDTGGTLLRIPAWWLVAGFALAGCTPSPSVSPAPREPASAAAILSLHNPWGARFLRAMEFVDFPDVLVGIAARNDQIWTRYESNERRIGRRTSLEQRWNQAISVPIAGPIEQQLVAIAQIFTEGGFRGLRGYPIDDAGGDFAKDAQGKGYDRLTLAQYRALSANQVLVSEMIPDRENRAAPGSTVLARYRYPSAGTWLKFRHLLSPGLQQELAAAESAGQLRYDLREQRSVRPAFDVLTRKILLELLRKAYVPGAPAWANYQRLISVHPFTDYNGRSLRAWYRQQAGTPLFLLDFYCDLYCTPAQFAAEVRRGQAQYGAIVRGMQAEERRNPQFPRFYEGVVDYWAVAAGLSAPPRDAGRMIAESVAWWNVPANSRRVDSKLFSDVLRDYAAFVRQRQF